MTEPDQEKHKPSFLGPHEDRELELMLAGKKHLSSFILEEGIGREIFPEGQFDRHVAEGLFVKDVRVEQYVSADGEDIRVRSILYATAGEAWRIPAMRTIQDIYHSMGPGWRPDLERVVGSLLGYDRNDVELFVERLAKRHG
ncbi:MAG: hypothetical protein V4517_11480 [Pseudomonadota bacterium]